MSERRSVDESGTKMQQSCAATTLVKPNIIILNSRFIENVRNKLIGSAFCFWHLYARTLQLTNDSQTSSDPGFSKLDFLSLAQYYRATCIVSLKGCPRRLRILVSSTEHRNKISF